MSAKEKNRKLAPLEWQAPLSEYASQLRFEGLRDSTIQTRVSHVETMARAVVVPPEAVTPTIVRDYAAARSWKPETRHGVYVSLRRYFDWWATTTGRPNPLPVLPTVRRPAQWPRPCPERVYAESLRRASILVQLILMLAGDAGLRRTEIICVRRTDIRQDLAGYVLDVPGKGGVLRTVPIVDEFAELIQAEFDRHPESAWLFPGRAGHVSSSFAGKHASRALGGGWSLHSLRHRFATLCYSVERDILAVQQLLGHSNVATTQRYAAPPQDAMRRAVVAASSHRLADTADAAKLADTAQRATPHRRREAVPSR